MSKIIAYSRISHHGVTDPLSGATIPSTNDHTDGTWTITDIYDREMMVNTSNGNLQYRAGNDIYNVVTTTFNQVKVYTFQIGNWDMSTAGATNVVNIGVGSLLANKNIVSLDAMIYPDPTTALFPGYQFKYNQIDGSIPANSPLNLSVDDITTGSFSISIPGTGTNFFRSYANSLDATFTNSSINRGYICVSYIE